MRSNFDTLKEQAKALPAHQRADLAHELITSLDAELDVDIETTWDEEIEKRVAEIKSGRAKGRIAEDILADIRAKFS